MPILNQQASSGGGSSAAVPYAEQQVAVTVDDTTYDNPITGGKLRTLVFDGEGAALGIAQLGDAFPRYLIASDASDGIGMGDGTMNPYFGAGSAALSRGSSGLVRIGVQGGPSLVVGSSTNGTDPGLVSSLSRVQFGARCFVEGLGDPNIANVGGAVGDLFFRGDGDGSVAQTIYICTVADPTNATWVGLT